ncbi:sigma-70 family RNA polymerase sigma factor [Chamaesiphon sp. VAR_48_metabat_135_sub]|uniref:sigma-70 family RNA polymerase sigma factor n=1 Tax=Chamaesiphon sp. VAR_48_metabat_135_sub TaxID=2964699 RepID=UPI00286B4A04|nr:sigma-70 family RNA polymerase sigma factor [Chamaesiphon sp. VAR_48_metabat_135_sub]
MRQRKDLIEIFSTFLQFEDDRSQGWAIDPRLNRSMTRSIQVEARGSEDFWAIYWLRQYAQKSAATDRALQQEIGHLSAYLQETCFWAVNRVMPRVSSIQMKLSDCFQVAIADVPKLLAAFDASKPTGLKTYANTVFSNCLRDHLRQRREIDFCTDWGLLQKISRKRLLDALTANNFDKVSCDRYYVAWQALTSHHSSEKSPKLRSIAVPEAQTWQLIEQSYNRDRKEFPHLTAATAKELEKCLLDAAKKVRSYLYPTVNSLNVKKGDDTEADWESDLVGNEAEPMVYLEEQETRAERQTQQQQMVAVLHEAIGKLDEPAAQLLTLYYRDRATQQNIAQQLEIPQYTVSRKLSRVRETLLKEIVAWGQTTLHIEPTSDVIAAISPLLEEWLESFYKQAKHPEKS